MESESPHIAAHAAVEAGGAGRVRIRGRVGLFSIGLAAYWPQFPGLKERLEGYAMRVADRVGSMG